MDSKLYLTIASIVAILYALGFLLIPTTLALFFSGMLEPHETLNLRFGGAADLAWGMILWFARDWNREAVRGVLISSAVGLAIIIVVNIRGTVMGLLNSNAWVSTVVLGLLLLGLSIFCTPTRARQRNATNCDDRNVKYKSGRLKWGPVAAPPAHVQRDYVPRAKCDGIAKSGGARIGRAYPDRAMSPNRRKVAWRCHSRR